MHVNFIVIAITFSEKKMKALLSYHPSYLGVEQNHNIEYKNEKEKLECVMRQKIILNTQLSTKNEMQAYGLLAVPVLRYSFGIINWHQE
jgi:hypothetical protein